jgi:CDP-4-dehydro-6-deoxyglucose reductase
MHVVDEVTCRISSVENLSGNVLRIKLELTREGFMYRAGQYIDLVLPDGSKRSFSIANRPQDDGLIELHVRQLPGGLFIQKVLDSQHQEGELSIEGPFGNLYFRDEQDCHSPAILIASGTGFSSFKAMLEQLVAEGIQRPIHLYWGVRFKCDLYLHHWVLQQMASMPNLHYVPVLSEAKLEDHWSGRTGYVHHAVMDDFPNLNGFQVYACGAPVVVELAKRDFVLRCGLPDDQFFC